MEFSFNALIVIIHINILSRALRELNSTQKQNGLSSKPISNTKLITRIFVLPAENHEIQKKKARVENFLISLWTRI